MKALVTGAARGLGLGLCTVLKSHGYEVIAACRTATPEIEALGVRVVTGIDLSTQASIAALRAGVGGDKLDLVVCNAGLNASFAAVKLSEVDLDVMAYEYQVNALGSVRTAIALTPSLREGAKVIFITTGSGVTGKNPPSPGQWGYRMSKMALHTMAYQLSAELRPQGVAVRLVSPGAVNTDLMQRIFAAGRITTDPDKLPSPVVAAERLYPRIAELTLENTGQWVNFSGEVWS